jgi:hypothetical protein
MHVVRHEAVRVEVAPPALAQLSEVAEIHEPIAVFPKGRLAVVAALVDMQRYAAKDEPRMPRHDGTTIVAAWRLTCRQ